MLGGLKVEELSEWVPSNGIGAPLDVEVTAGAADPAGDAPLPPELTVPPTAWIDCQLPLVPE